MSKKKKSLIREIYPYRKYIYLGVLLILSLYMFSQTANVPIADKLGKTYTERIIQENALQEIERENPYLPQSSKEDILNRITSEYLKSDEGKANVQYQQQLIRQYYQNPSHVTYLYNYDPYFYLRQADNLLKNGHTGEYLKNGVPQDNLRLSGTEQKMYFSLVPYFIVGIYQIIKTPNQDSIELGAFWFPVFFGALSVLMLFILGNFLFNPEIALISSLAFLLHPGVFNVFKGGATDTTAINVFWSILIIFFLLKAIDAILHINSKKWVDWLKIIGYLSLVAISFVLFYLTWAGFFYLFAIIAFGLLAYLIFFFIQTKNKKNKIYLGSAVALLLIFFYLLKDSTYVYKTLFRLNLVNDFPFFPKALTHISELQGMSFASLINLLGIVFFSLVVLGSLILLHKQFKKVDEKIFLLAWVSLIILPLFSKRFYIYSLAPAAILFSYGLDNISKWISKIDLGLKAPVRRIITLLLIFSLFLLFSIPETSKELNNYPYTDDAVYEISSKIKKNTSENTVLTTWWDYGYIYEYYTRRPLTFDGGIFSSQRVYWVAKTLLSKNEEEALGIIRMLNCKGERAAFHIVSKHMNSLLTIQTINNAIRMNKEQAQDYYNKSELPEYLLPYTHCESPPGVLILSSDMLRKIPTINYFATWNFEYKLSFGGEIVLRKGECSHNVCAGGVVFDLEKNESSINGEKPKKFIYINRDFTNKTIITNTDGIEITILIVGNDIYIMDYGFEETILIKGLFLNDLENFELFDLQDLRKRIVAYRVDHK